MDIKAGELSHLGEIVLRAKKIEEVGSRVTCRPMPENSDRDWLILVREIKYTDTLDYYSKRELKDWEQEGSAPTSISFSPEEDNKFRSFRKGEDNIILTTDEEFFNRFMAATSIAFRLNLQDKNDRIALFQAVLYGNMCW